MIQKKSWNEMIDWAYDHTTVSNWLIRHLDELISAGKITESEKRNITDVWKAVMAIFGLKLELVSTEGENPEFELTKDYDLSPWKNMPIFITSFRPLGSYDYLSKMFFDLSRYMDAYAMLLTNDGFAKKFYRDSQGQVTNKVDSKTKDYYSETPQVSSGDEDLDNLDYLSNASKNFVNSNGKTTATDNVIETTTSWEEARKNYEMLYFKDICSFMMKIPQRVYNFYALDQYPVSYSYKELFETVKNLRNIYE